MEGQPGCVYAVRRWGFALRPSALVKAGFDPTPLLATDDDGELLVLRRSNENQLPYPYPLYSMGIAKICVQIGATTQTSRFYQNGLLNTDKTTTMTTPYISI